MTNYSRVLERLSRETASEPVRVDDGPAPVADPVATPHREGEPEFSRPEPTASWVDPVAEASRPLLATVPGSLRQLDTGESYGGLLDAIRGIGDLRGEVPFVVLAAASRTESIERVSGGLVHAGRRRGLRVVALELVVTPGGRLIRGHSEADDDSVGLASFPIASTRPAAEIQEWLSNQLDRFDAVIVAAPPLSETSDGALLGRGLDGLFVVAEQGRTRDDLLRAAIQRAKAAASPVHGLVLIEAKDSLPTWLARLLGSGNR